MIKVDSKSIMACTGCTPTLAAAYLEIIVGAAIKFDINTPKRFAAWLANVSEESEQLTMSRENLNFSAQGLANTWPKRYKASNGQPNALALSLHRQPEKIANNVYASRLGNGNEASGDGWRYRGAGWIQTTGKTNTTKALVALGFAPDADPSVLEKPANAALSAAFFWKSNGCNELADKDMFSQTVKVVNGQLPCEANEGSKRIARYRAGVAALNELNKG